jgi:hypothetical protein
MAVLNDSRMSVYSVMQTGLHSIESFEESFSW